VTLAEASGKTEMVSYATADGTATAGSDYTAVTGTLTFAPGEITKTVTVPVIGDTLTESAETFTLTLTRGSDAPLAKAQGIATITDDDLLLEAWTTTTAASSRRAA
jgi:chitinase